MTSNPTSPPSKSYQKSQSATKKQVSINEDNAPRSTPVADEQELSTTTPNILEIQLKRWRWSWTSLLHILWDRFTSMIIRNRLFLKSLSLTFLLRALQVNTNWHKSRACQVTCFQTNCWVNSIHLPYIRVQRRMSGERRCLQFQFVISPPTRNPITNPTMTSAACNDEPLCFLVIFDLFMFF